MTKHNTIEILAPVGSREMLTAAVYSGADAVYLGFDRFNARSSAGNFDAQTLKEAVAFCHGRGVRVHVAMNTTLYGRELAGAAEALRAIAESGADAVICQDMAVAMLAKQIAPDLPLHGSTQMSVHTLAGAQKLAEMGFARAILARELSLPEIEHITKHCGIETEVFVHGALCMSVSGQCYMSAFLGGRSGNRGSCAGPCRLPFDAAALPEGVPGRSHHLSLKDNSVIDRLPALIQAGVASVKIEGRLRTPEYVAAAVNACYAAREGLAYDRQLLQGAFSRSGFTSGYLDGRLNGGMFGTRSEADADATKKALPALRELFRRERQRVPVTMLFEAEEFGAKLTVIDCDGNKAVVYGDADCQPANNDPTPALRRSLEKCGGTPFLPVDIRVEMDGGPWYLPGSCINEMRRSALDALLKKRETIRPWPTTCYRPAADTAADKHANPAVKPLRARFVAWAQVPEDVFDFAAQVIVPLGEWKKVPEQHRDRVVLELPRVMFGKLEIAVTEGIAATKELGFAGYEANNIAHIRLAAGLPLSGGIGLNLTNPVAAQQYADFGVTDQLILPEVKIEDMGCIAPQGAATGAMIYGHMPLMLTRACPLHNLHGCDGCTGKGELTDRKAKKFPVRCGLGVRTIYNPVPIYMGDKTDQLPVDWVYAHFTTESRRRCGEVLRLVQSGAAFDSEFTRGLYYKGTV